MKEKMSYLDEDEGSRVVLENAALPGTFCFF